MLVDGGCKIDGYSSDTRTTVYGTISPRQREVWELEKKAQAAAFGIRLEDCLYMTDAGPKFFTQPSPAIDRPFA